MKKLMSFALMLLMLLASACSGTRKTNWKEEVQLADGSVIVVQRSAQAHGFGEMGGPGGLRDLKESLQVVSSPYTMSPQWNDIYAPILLDYDARNKEWFLIATFYMCEDWRRLGRPKSPYLEYRVREGKWTRVELDSVLVGHETNLLTGPNFIDGEPEMLRLSAKRDRRGNVAKRFNNILSVWTDNHC
ncbi:MAG: hypothetical protein JWN23_1627 [Rhodocyclales bacterium]|nr:hypothetical protein [Rhodocyclales bacterium]